MGFARIGHFDSYLFMIRLEFTLVAFCFGLAFRAIGGGVRIGLARAEGGHLSYLFIDFRYGYEVFFDRFYRSVEGFVRVFLDLELCHGAGCQF